MRYKYKRIYVNLDLTEMNKYGNQGYEIKLTETINGRDYYLLEKANKTQTAQSRISLPIEERKTNFINEVAQYKEQYSRNLLGQFIEYWTQAANGDSKMLFEKQKSFGMKARLNTFQRNNKSWSNEKPIVKNNL